MRQSFTKRDVFFREKSSQRQPANAYRGEEGKDDDERGKSHSNSHSCSVWLKVDGRGRWAAYSSRNTSLDSPPIVVCVCFSWTQFVRFMAAEGSSLNMPSRHFWLKKRIINIHKLMHLYSKPIAQVHVQKRSFICNLQYRLLSLFYLVAQYCLNLCSVYALK